MTPTIKKRNGILTLAGLAIGLMFLLACSTQPTATTNGAANVPTGSQTSFNETNGALRTTSVFDGQGPSSGIHVTGQGRASAAPDIANLNLGVESFAGTVAEARDEAAAAMQEVLNVLRSQGVDEKDIQTSYFNISPRYSSREVTHCVDSTDAKFETPEGPVQILPREECFQDREQVITGYQVTNQLSVTIRDLEDVGTVIDSVTGAAGNLIRFRGVNFSIEDTQELQRQAREAAVQDMNNKAEQLAEFSGVQLGTIVLLTETGGQMPLNVGMERMAFDSAFAASVPTQILGGELDVVVTVQGVYAIQ